jgi:hypothetical protein
MLSAHRSAGVLWGKLCRLPGALSLPPGQLPSTSDPAAVTSDRSNLSLTLMLSKGALRYTLSTRAMRSNCLPSLSSAHSLITTRSSEAAGVLILGYGFYNVWTYQVGCIVPEDDDHMVQKFPERRTDHFPVGRGLYRKTAYPRHSQGVGFRY